MWPFAKQGIGNLSKTSHCIDAHQISLCMVFVSSSILIIFACFCNGNFTIDLNVGKQKIKKTNKDLSNFVWKM